MKLTKEEEELLLIGLVKFILSKYTKKRIFSDDNLKTHKDFKFLLAMSGSDGVISESMVMLSIYDFIQVNFSKFYDDFIVEKTEHVGMFKLKFNGFETMLGIGMSLNE